ncbi:hypothetical protein GFS31_40220 [Leptolyngbya sp. BL0902]|nr:hypothetical protein GFS31_40220 [Leptolyngbya sp. BL0902]
MQLEADIFTLAVFAEPELRLGRPNSPIPRGRKPLGAVP